MLWRSGIVVMRNATIWIAVIIIAAWLVLDTIVDAMDYVSVGRSGRSVTADERHL